MVSLRCLRPPTVGASELESSALMQVCTRELECWCAASEPAPASVHHYECSASSTFCLLVALRIAPRCLCATVHALCRDDQMVRWGATVAWQW